MVIALEDHAVLDQGVPTGSLWGFDWPGSLVREMQEVPWEFFDRAPKPKHGLFI